MEKIRALVQDDLNKVEKLLSDIMCNDNNIITDVKSFLSGSSKRIRSIFGLLYIKSYNVSVNDEIITILTAAELIHNASLLHDDVIDDGSIRRGVPTVFSTHGSKISVLSGDYILSLAIEMLLKLKNIEILNIFLRTAKDMCKAEVIQYINRNNQISEDIYLNIVNGKTASLFSAITKTLALLYGFDISLSERIGLKFGEIFQINNDLEPISLNNDKQNGVNTVIDILGIEKTLALKDNYKKEMSELLKQIPENRYRQGIEDLVDIL